MALNYQFYNNTLEDVQREVRRRQQIYWPNGQVNNTSLAWNYQKTAYIILKAIEVDFDPKSKKTIVKPNDSAPVKRIQSPTAPILELYGSNYTNSNGVLRGAVLNSAEITTEGTYSSILRITVNFTVFDKDELDNYMNSFLRPGADIGLEWGWTLDELEGNKGDKDGTNAIYVNKGDIRGTVFNFSFSAKEDGTWDCSLNAFGPSIMTYGFNSDAKDASNVEPDPTNYATYSLMDIFRTVKENITTLYDSGDVVTSYCKKVWAGELVDYLKSNTQKNKKKEGPIFYIYKLLLNIANRSSETDENFTHVAYITLDNLISLINDKINKLSKRTVPNYSFQQEGKNICVISKLHSVIKYTGPAESFNVVVEEERLIGVDKQGIMSQFAFTTQRNGAPGSTQRLNLSLIGSSEIFAKELSSDNIPVQHLVLVNVDFILEEFHKILQGDKYVQDKKILSFLKSLFRQLEVNTGGIINLQIQPERDKFGNIISILILNETGDPENLADTIRPFEIPMMTKGSIVRSMNIESKVPDAVVSEVATFTRAGVSYGDPASTSGGINITEAEESLEVLIQELDELNKTWVNNISGDQSKIPTNTRTWNNKVKNIYRKTASIQQSITLNYNGERVSKFNIFNLKTAVFPIYLKLTLDGINGFLYGNAIKTNWLPKQYRDSRIYWTVMNIRHKIENNDWTTELEAIYRVKEK